MKVNLAKSPFIPDGFTLESHIKGDKAWEFDASKIELFVSEKQKESYQVGTDLQKEVPNPFNANLLWFLYKHQELIPEEWKKYSAIYFWGTILRSPNGGRRVLYLYVDGSEWDWNCYWLDGPWNAGGPSASLASPKSSLPFGFGKTISQPDFTPEEKIKLKKFVETLKDPSSKEEGK